MLEYTLLASLLLLQSSYGPGQKVLVCLLSYHASLSYAGVGSMSMPDGHAIVEVGTRRLLPSFMAGGLLLSTTTSYDLGHGHRKWHQPESLLLTLAGCLRYLPMIGQTRRQLHRNLRLRGWITSP
ncbi:energy-coupling factor transporter transmembrane component T [Streptococcus hyointestinalis]|uniref:energy-coupling factor transporter transmembrane component T n=1 Tax=Streptococcus hyointestinalis TaxID=1337 RepID=UPI0013E08F70|nr:energy-coupling factor transporter transmembrane component T [Streptococcus hyointestinalis]